MDIKIGIAYHKPSAILQGEHFLPIQVGKALSDVDLHIQGDDEGDNISSKNPLYCELTGLYWLWKNTSADYKGLMHYRRIFTKRNSFSFFKFLLRVKYKERQFASLWSPYRSMGVKKQYNCQDIHVFQQRAKDFSSHIEELLSDGTNMVVPHPGRFYISIRQFIYQHANKQQIDLMDEIVEKTFPDIYPSYKKSLDGQRLYNCNMSVMDKDSFDEYCNFIFTVLKKHEEEVVNRGFLNSSSEKTYARVPGYLGELLTNAYIQYSFQKGKKIKVLPVLFLEEENTQERKNAPIQLLKRLYYTYFKGVHKNLHFPYMFHGCLMQILPNAWYRLQLKKKLNAFDSLPEEEKKYIKDRVDYYCRLEDGAKVCDINEHLPRIKRASKSGTIKDYKFKNKVGNTSYFFDTYEYMRYFPTHFRFLTIPGDVFYHLPSPAIVKSRPIAVPNMPSNEVILNLDKIRHFTWINDPFKWEDKECRILFRGEITNKPRRCQFFDMWKDHPLCDLSDTSSMSIYDHLYYRYIMSLEGNDVASNLKWVMSSNSIAVMPRPTCETWYMEGQLIPNYHYIEIASDYHDLIDRINYYEAHPEEAEAIIQHAHEWVAQFQNKKREDLISLMVLDKYFQKTGQPVI